MKRYRGFAGVGLAVIAMAGCSPDALIPGYHLDNPDKSNVVISPTSYMAAVGCSPHQGPRDSTTIAFRLIRGGMVRFDCGAATKSSIRNAIHAYRDAVFANTGAITSGGGGDAGYVYVHTYYSCDIYNHYQYVPAMGEYVYTYSDVSCTYWEIWSDPGGSGYTPPPPPPPGPIPLPIPPVPPDTCRAGDVVGTYPAGGALAGEPGPMNSSDMQAAARALFADARAANTEMGGYFYQATPNGPILFARVAGDPRLTDNCQYYAGSGGPALGTIIAYIHTHQAPEGVATHCRIGNYDLNPQNSKFGGGSTADWNKATTQQRPEYTIDANAIWRLDPTTSIDARSSNPNQWTRQGNACATHAAS